MRFYFPDSQDLVSPSYDFLRDEYPAHRVRQRDDRYAHEVLDPAPYDGILVSKAIVDGSVTGSGKYSSAQRERLYRLGARKFFRIPDGVATLGDCGAFNYVNEDKPPYTVDEVLDFYEGCGFDAGVSVDHVVLGYDRELDESSAPPEWVDRRRISLRYAEDFLAAARGRGTRLEPVGAAQGWSPASYANSVQELQTMGYQRIALGGMVPLKTRDILESLASVAPVLEPDTRLHLLGVTRLDAMNQFVDCGVESFDSTSPFRQAFMDDRHNYHTLTDAYVAIRIPQVDGNASLKRAILSGRVSQREAVVAERTALNTVREFDRGSATLDDTLRALADYEGIVQPRRSYLEDYRRTLEAAPWQGCVCHVCQDHRVEVAIFRGTERNKRRGFHNIHVFNQRMARDLTRQAGES